MARLEMPGHSSVSGVPLAEPCTAVAAPPRQAVRREAVVTSSVLLIYLAVGLTAFWPVLPATSNRLFGEYTPDPGLSAWFLGWAAQALHHAQNPFFSHAIFVPHGVNLAVNTSAPLLGIIATPITLVFGPIASANLLMVLAMPISAAAAFVVLRRWHAWLPAAALGGLMYGFSPYMVGQSLGHMTLVFVPVPPFIALVVVSIVQGNGSRLWHGIILGLLVTAQFLISPEVLATVVILIAFALFCAAIRYRGNLLAILRRTIVPACVAIAISTALLAYPLWMMVAGPERFRGPVQGFGNPYFNDLLSFAVPGPLQRVAPGMRSLGVRLAPNGSEFGGYIGLPVLLIASLFAFRSRCSSRMQLCVLLVCTAGLISLGPYLSVNGHLSHFPLPYLLLSKIPLLNNLLPVRVSFEVDACVAAIVAFGLDDWRWAALPTRSARSTSATRTSLVFSLVVLVVVVTQLPEWPYASQTSPNLPATIRDAIPSGDPITITYPYSGRFSSTPMVWQAESGFKFRLSGGDGLHAGPTGAATGWPYLMTPPRLQQFLAGETPPSVFGPPLAVNSMLVKETRHTLAANDIRLVLVERSFPNSNAVVNLFSRAIGPPQRSAKGFVVWATTKRSL